MNSVDGADVKYDGCSIVFIHHLKNLCATLIVDTSYIYTYYTLYIFVSGTNKFIFFKESKMHCRCVENVMLHLHSTVGKEELGIHDQDVRIFVLSKFKVVSWKGKTMMKHESPGGHIW